MSPGKGRGRGRATGRASGRAGIVPRAGGLVGRTPAPASEPGVGHRSATFGPRSRRRRPVGVSANAAVTAPWRPGIGTNEKSPPRPEPGGPGGRGSMLLVDPVGALALVGFEGLDGQAEFLAKGGGYKRARRVRKPTGGCHDFGERRAILALQHRDDLLGLAAFARPSTFLRLGSLFGFGRVLHGGGLLGRLGLRGRALGGPVGCPWPFFWGLGFSGFSRRLWGGFFCWAPRLGWPRRRRACRSLFLFWRPWVWGPSPRRGGKGNGQGPPR